MTARKVWWCEYVQGLFDCPKHPDVSGVTFFVSQSGTDLSHSRDDPLPCRWDGSVRGFPVKR